jgi:dCTP deaminase
MILSDTDIKKALEEGRIKIDPPPSQEQFSPSAVDLVLGDEFLQFLTPKELNAREPRGARRPLAIDCFEIDIREFQNRYAKEILDREDDGSFRMEPGIFTLARTRERIHLPKSSKIAARVEGRSTLARLGLVVHMTAPVIHADFEGVIALEMYNFNHYPLLLRPNELRICQLVLEEVSNVPEGELMSAHQHQGSVS